MKPIMLCGHRANSRHQSADVAEHDCCVICSGSLAACTVAPDQPDLSTREAECTYCQTRRPSTENLAFFEYRGPGSAEANERCRCGYYRLAHGITGSRACQTFEPNGPWATDLYYCGCRGWD